jgi:hypothetical protein
MKALRESADATVRERLERALAETRGEPVAVAELSRRPFEYETSFAIDALDVLLAGGEQLALIVKDLGAGLSPAAAGAKPAFTLDPRREVAVYRELLAGSGLSTPHLYGTWLDPAAGGAWLFLERVEGEVLTDVGEAAIWREAAAWSAGLDAAVADGSAGPTVPLLHRDGVWHRHWLEAAAATLAEDQGEDAASLAARLRADRDHLVERLEELPTTFVHGELYASNVLIERGAGTTRIAPVDWELAGLGPYALDLAALVAGWGESERMEMIGAFHEALPPPLRELGLERTVQATDLCRLALAVQWIGWARGWQPPEGHRHDWAAEATELLDRVGAR